MRNRRSSLLRKDYKAHIPILVQEGPWAGESVLLVPRRPNGLDRYPWLLCKKVDGRVIERRFCSEQVMSSAWQPRNGDPS